MAVTGWREGQGRAFIRTFSQSSVACSGVDHRRYRGVHIEWAIVQTAL